MDRKPLLAIAAVAVLLGGVGAAVAATSAQTDTAEPDISKAQAMQTAADHVGGTAQSAELEQEDGPVWEVAVTQENGPAKEVEIDGTSGDVLEVEDEDEDDGFEADEFFGSDD
jgi:uncharacterized membrane protein YkoI